MGGGGGATGDHERAGSARQHEEAASALAEHLRQVAAAAVGLAVEGEVHRQREVADHLLRGHREQARDLWAWLEDGAEFFVCGDKERMAADVERELHHIVETEGGRTPDQAKEYVEAMRKTKRYKRDVY